MTNRYKSVNSKDVPIRLKTPYIEAYQFMKHLNSTNRKEVFLSEQHYLLVNNS